MSPRAVLTVTILGAFLMTGCRQTQPVSNSIPTGPMDICVIPINAALFPLQNVTENPDAGERVTAILGQHLLSSGMVDLVPDGAVRAAMTNHRVRWTNRVDLDVASAMAAELGVTHLVLGSVTTYADQPEPSIALSVQILNVKTRETDFSATHTLSAHDREGAFQIGRPTTAAALANIATSEIVDQLWEVFPIAGVEKLSGVERKRFMTRGASALAEVRRNAVARASERNEEELARLRDELSAANSRADSTFRTLAITQSLLERCEGQSRDEAELPRGLLRFLNETNENQLKERFNLSDRNAAALIRFRDVLGPIDGAGTLRSIPNLDLDGRTAILNGAGEVWEEPDGGAPSP